MLVYNMLSRSRTDPKRPLRPCVMSHGTVNQHPLFADMSADSPSLR